MAAVQIRPLGADGDAALLEAHFARHRAEHEAGSPFMPHTPDDEGPGREDLARFALGLDVSGWQRCWGAFCNDAVVGHVDLAGGRLHSELHRAVLGIGLEAPWRAAGHGRALMQVAIDFCRAAPTLLWLDLNVFAHNTPAVALYEALGFQRNGCVQARFRVNGMWVDDLSMTLSVD